MTSNGPHKTDTELLGELRRASRLARTPGTLSGGWYERNATKHGLPSKTTYRNRFGSWGAAVRQAGLRTGPLPRPLVYPKLYAALRKLTLELGHFPLICEYQEARDQDGSLPSLHAFTSKQKWSVWRERTMQQLKREAAS